MTTTTSPTPTAPVVAAHDPACVFCRIIDGKLPSRLLHEDEHVVAFHDINPAAPVHFLIVPRRHVPSLEHMRTAEDAALMAHIMQLAPRLAAQAGCGPYPRGGFRVVINTGEEGGQEVHHLHVHVMGGPRPWKNA